jgi:hypothetical protein
MKLALAACAAAALATLSACNRSAEAASAAPDIDLPVVAAGKWRWTQMTDGKGGDSPGERCFPERTIWEAMEVGAAGIKSCERSVEKTGSGFIARYHCETRQTTTNITATISGDFNSSYRFESVQTFDPPLGKVSRQTIAIRAERLAGASCK